MTYLEVSVSLRSYIHSYLLVTLSGFNLSGAVSVSLRSYIHSYLYFSIFIRNFIISFRLLTELYSFLRI